MKILERFYWFRIDKINSITTKMREKKLNNCQKTGSIL